MFTPPDRLTSCLLFLGSLNQGSNSVVKQNVITLHKKQVQKYFVPGSFEANYLPGSFNGAKLLLNAMLSTQDNFGEYNTLTNTTECVQKYADALSSNLLFQASSALLFLVFQTDSDYSMIKGNKWQNEQLNQTGKDLNKWLTSSETDQFMARGFTKGELSSNQGFGIASIKLLVKLESPMALQNALLTLLFLGSWHDSKLGHACLFLQALCQEVQSDKFQDKFLEVIPGGEYSKFKTICKELKDTLQPLVSGSENKIKPVCQSNTGLYTQVWPSGNMKPDQFQACLMWLRQNIYDIQRSLTSMKSDCSNWNEGALQSGTSAGPFKYGFVPASKDSTHREWIQTAKGKLEGAINTLLNSQAFKCLLVTLFKPSNLKHCLQLLGSLNQSKNEAVKNRVIRQLEKKVEKYCASGSQYLTSTFQSNLTNAFSGAHGLLNVMLEMVDYGSYQNSSQADKFVGVLSSNILFQCYAALYFLYFMTSDDGSLTSIQGAGLWSQYSLSNPGTLKNWLKDDQKTLTPGLIDRGFNDVAQHFQSTNGESLANPSLKMLIGHDSAKALQNALLGLLFLGPWHDSKLGHACLFLWTFCDRVTGQANAFETKSPELKRLRGLKWDKFKEHCQSLKDELDKFVQGAGFETVKIHAVCQEGNDKLYSTIWDPKHFKHYLLWLCQNIYDIKVSLYQMKKDAQGEGSSEWTKENLNLAKTAGPFRYGFVFKTWDGSSLKGKLKGPIEGLTKALYKVLLSIYLPNTLKDCLQLMAKLHTLGDLRKTVIAKVSERVGKYCAGTYMNTFAETSGSLYGVFQHSDKLLKKILNKQDDYRFGLYNDLTDSDHKDDPNCVHGIVMSITILLPQCYAALHYLYFMTSENLEKSIRGAGQWSEQHVNGNSGSTNLKNWLIEKPDQRTLTPGLIARGFDGVLFCESTSGSKLADQLKKLIGHDSPKPLQNALLGLLFLGLWHDSKLGHAICFLRKFSVLVRTLKPQFESVVGKDDVSWPRFQSVCQSLKSDLGKFVPNAGILYAVCNENTSLYDNVWEEDKFTDYVTWLRMNLHSIVGALRQMEKDSAQWNAAALKSAQSAGPFRYGFVFKDAKWPGKIHSQLRDPIKSLIASLRALSYIMDPILNIIDCTIGATALGLKAVAEIGIEVLQAGAKTP